MTSDHDGLARRALGDHGEDLVAAWYERRGYTIVVRNWRCRNGEIDIVASKSGVVVICEVKTRSNGRFGLPVEAVTPLKVRRLRQLAVAFLAQSPVHGGEVRFDVASVKGSSIDVLMGAF